jgi:hypothetical protein
MKVEQIPETFRPITITLETHDEFMDLKDALQHLASIKAQFNYTNTIRSLLKTLETVE